jgi:hypothetical protein
MIKDHYINDINLSCTNLQKSQASVGHAISQ